jgi:hypothetical protein
LTSDVKKIHVVCFTLFLATDMKTADLKRWQRRRKRDEEW